jgi:hypothetical protein
LEGSSHEVAVPQTKSPAATRNNSATQALWQALNDHGADLVLAGHDHNYERFSPHAATGTAEPTRGVRSFVVGTGGKEKRSPVRSCLSLLSIHRTRVEDCTASRQRRGARAASNGRINRPILQRCSAPSGRWSVAPGTRST